MSYRKINLGLCNIYYCDSETLNAAGDALADPTDNMTKLFGSKGGVEIDISFERYSVENNDSSIKQQSAITKSGATAKFMVNFTDATNQEILFKNSLDVTSGVFTPKELGSLASDDFQKFVFRPKSDTSDTGNEDVTFYFSVNEGNFKKKFAVDGEDTIEVELHCYASDYSAATISAVTAITADTINSYEIKNVST